MLFRGTWADPRAGNSFRNDILEGVFQLFPKNPPPIHPLQAQLTTDAMPEQKTFMDPKGGSSRHRGIRIPLLIPILIPILGL